MELDLISKAKINAVAIMDFAVGVLKLLEQKRIHMHSETHECV